MKVVIQEIQTGDRTGINKVGRISMITTWGTLLNLRYGEAV
jgi:hypothetical protein